MGCGMRGRRSTPRCRRASGDVYQRKAPARSRRQIDRGAVGAFKVGAPAGALEVGGWKCPEEAALFGNHRAPFPDVSTEDSHIDYVITFHTTTYHAYSASISVHFA